MFESLKERYNNNKRFQKIIWDVKVFSELTEKQEILLKIIYFLDNIFKEDLKNICFYLVSDDSFDNTLKKLRDEGYIFYKRNRMGTVYALTNKSIQKFEPYSENYVKSKIGDKQLFSSKIKGGIIAKQFNDYILDSILDEFLNQNSNQIAKYIYNQFVRNFRFKDFIKKTTDEKIDELKCLKNLNKKDMDSLLKIKSYNNRVFNIYYKSWIQKHKIVQQDKRYYPFRKRFLESLENMDDQLRYYLKDFSKTIYNQTWDKVSKSFSSEDNDFQNEYIIKQYIKHKEYKSIKKRDGEEIAYLLKLKFSGKEIIKYFNLEENDINRIEMIYEKIIKEDILKKSGFKLFREHFYNVIKKDKTRYHSDYLSDYRKNRFPNMESILINYFKEIDSNYLKGSNSNISFSFGKIFEKLQISNEGLLKIRKLEKYNISYELYSSYERSIKKIRNDLLKKQDNELVDEKNKELEEVKNNLKNLKKEITILENDLSFRLLEKENGKPIERAFTLRILQRNSIFIENIKIEKEILYGNELGKIKVNVGFLDNTENGLQPYLIFNKIFIIHMFLTQLINKEGVLDLHINIYTFNENRKQLLDNRMTFVKEKMKRHRQAFSNLQDQITTIDTTIHGLRLWEFYNQVKLEIEKGVKINEN